MRSYHGFLSALKLDALIEIKLHVFSLFPIGLTCLYRRVFKNGMVFRSSNLGATIYVVSNTRRVPIAYGKIDTSKITGRAMWTIK